MSSFKLETAHLTFKQKKNILLKAKGICARWWVDILDCEKSYARQRVEMSFENIMATFSSKCHFTMIYRRNFGEDHLEIAFSTFTNPEHFLWILLDKSVDIKHDLGYKSQKEIQK